ncbi:MAG TPA: alpha/beta hydrolase [Gaiellaceae bacterium]|nr:alpha/beta hydrolase [Gaiellaceae bacterium]
MLVHGLGGTSARIWGGVADELADGYTVVTYDLRGTGGSERPPGPYSLDDFVGDLRGLVEAHGLTSPALVGHSFGGSIALAYTARYPDKVSAVVSIGGPVVLPEQGQQGLRDRAEKVEREGMASVAETVAMNGTAPSFRERDPEQYEELVDMLAANHPATYAATCRVLAEMDLRPELGRIWAPVLLVAGDRDGVVPPAAGDEIEAALPNLAGRVTVEDCGHNLTVERPDVLVAELRSFLRGRVAAPA